MKNLDHQLSRLLKSAAGATAPVDETAPAHLATRVMAHWRSGLSADDLFGWPVPLFRRALAGAFILMLLAFAWGYQELSETPADEVVVAEYEMQLTYLP